MSFWFPYPDTSIYHLLNFLLAFGGDAGSLGVRFFFILSGFLITYLLFVEQSKQTSINIGHFYLRRLLRIWPLYYLTLVAGFIIYPWLLHLGGQSYDENASGLLYTFFAVNFDHIYHGGPTIGILGVQWSVAIEEQFYLMWPLLFYFFSKKKIYPYLLIIFIVSSELFYLYTRNNASGYYHLISNFRFLSFGALLAYISYFHLEIIKSFLTGINKTTIVIIYLVCMTFLLFRHQLTAAIGIFNYVHDLVAVLFFGFVILEQNFSNHSVLKLGSIKLLNRLGKISYGLYLYHMMAIYFVRGVFPENTDYVTLKIMLTLSITILISYLSYNYFELFFLTLKNKFSSLSNSG